MKPQTSIFALVVVVALFSLNGETSIVQENDAASCLLTKPNGNAPPGEEQNANFHGGSGLWTALWPDGTVVFRPGGAGFVLEDGSLSMKFPWWRGVKGKLSIEGHRLNDSALPLRAKIPDGYGMTGFQASALIFPTEGCWKITGRAGDASLMFVIRVVKIEGNI